MKRLLTLVLIFTLLITVGTVTVFAEEEGGVVSTATADINHNVSSPSNADISTDITANSNAVVLAENITRGTASESANGITNAIVHAESSEIYNATDTDTEVTTPVTNDSLTDSDTEVTTPVTNDTLTDTKSDIPDADKTDAKEEESSFAKAYGIAVKNADKIFALFAFVSSLFVGFAYKRGLLPLLKSALSALGSGVASLKEQSEKAGEESTRVLAEAAEKLERAENTVSIIYERISALENELSHVREGAMRDGELRIILSSQIDMLYEIFMSSSLPSYQKDAIGEKVAEMKKALEAETEKK